MKKFAVKLIAVLGILLMGSQSVFASANSNAATAKDVDGVIVVTAKAQMLYVEAGRFFREYNAQLISDLTNPQLISKQTQAILDLIEVEAPQFAASFQVSDIADQ